MRGSAELQSTGERSHKGPKGSTGARPAYIRAGEYSGRILDTFAGAVCHYRGLPTDDPGGWGWNYIRRRTYRGVWGGSSAWSSAVGEPLFIDGWHRQFMYHEFVCSFLVRNSCFRLRSLGCSGRKSCFWLGRWTTPTAFLSITLLASLGGWSMPVPTRPQLLGIVR